MIIFIIIKHVLLSSFKAYRNITLGYCLQARRSFKWIVKLLMPNVDIYFVAATRAQSCKEIKDLGSSNGDGEYWIDPGKTKSPFKAYCDMTTDGGKV